MVDVTVTLLGNKAAADDDGTYVLDDDAESGFVTTSDGHKYRTFDAGSDGGKQKYTIIDRIDYGRVNALRSLKCYLYNLWRIRCTLRDVQSR